MEHVYWQEHHGLPPGYDSKRVALTDAQRAGLTCKNDVLIPGVLSSEQIDDAYEALCRACKEAGEIPPTLPTFARAFA